MVDMLKVYSQYFHIMLLPSQKPSSPDGYAILGGVPVPPNPKNPGSWIRPWGTSAKLSEP